MLGPFQAFDFGVRVKSDDIVALLDRTAHPFSPSGGRCEIGPAGGRYKRTPSNDLRNTPSSHTHIIKPGIPEPQGERSQCFASMPIDQSIRAGPAVVISAAPGGVTMAPISSGQIIRLTAVITAHSRALVQSICDLVVLLIEAFAKLFRAIRTRAVLVARWIWEAYCRLENKLIAGVVFLLHLALIARAIVCLLAIGGLLGYVQWWLALVLYVLFLGIAGIVSWRPPEKDAAEAAVAWERHSTFFTPFIRWTLRLTIFIVSTYFLYLRGSLDFSESSTDFSPRPGGQVSESLIARAPRTPEVIAHRTDPSPERQNPVEIIPTVPTVPTVSIPPHREVEAPIPEVRPPEAGVKSSEQAQDRGFRARMAPSPILPRPIEPPRPMVAPPISEPSGSDSAGPKPGDSETRTKVTVQPDPTPAPACIAANTGNFGFINSKTIRTLKVLVYESDGSQSPRQLKLALGQIDYVRDFPAGTHRYVVTYRRQAPRSSFSRSVPMTVEDFTVKEGQIFVEQCKSGFMELE